MTLIWCLHLALLAWQVVVGAETSVCFFGFRPGLTMLPPAVHLICACLEFPPFCRADDVKWSNGTLQLHSCVALTAVDGTANMLRPGP